MAEIAEGYPERLAAFREAAGMVTCEQAARNIAAAFAALREAGVFHSMSEALQRPSAPTP